MIRKIQLSALLFLAASGLHAQESGLYTYQDLSHIYYARQKDSLKKTWACPPEFKDKNTQKKYKDIWDERTESVTAAFLNDDYVHDKEVYNYIDGIVRQISEANRAMLPEKPLVLIDRSPSVNAYAMGGNILAVNLGLITFSHTREELALVIAHELSHNILHHY